MAAIAFAHGVSYLLDPYEGTIAFKVRDYGLPCLEAVHSRIFPRRFPAHDAVVVDDLYLLKPMPLPDQEVIGVMGRRYLDASRTELRVDHVVFDDRYHPAGDGHDDLFAYKVAVPLIPWVDRYRSVSQNGFRTGRHYPQVAVAISKPVCDFIEFAFLVFVLHLKI